MERRHKAGVPDEVHFATKPRIAQQQLQALLDEGAPPYCVVADAAYGTEAAFRQSLTDMGLPYMVGVTSSVKVWPPGVQPLPPKPWSGRGRPAVATRRTQRRQPVSVKTLARSLPEKDYSTVTWRQGTNEPLTGRFAALRIRISGHRASKQRLHPLQWLLIEWPANEEEPSNYWLSTLAENASLLELVRVAHLRWRIERDYQDLKQDFGLGHFEGRGWRGFHHHASLAIAAYGFLMAQRLEQEQCQPNHQDKEKFFLERQVPALPTDYVPRGSSPATRAAPHAELDHDAASAALQLPAD
jgi:SRSO17 transposase